MVVRTDMTLIKEIHVASIGKIYFRLLRDYLLNASKISRVVVLVVKIGVRTTVRGPVVIECFFHKEEIYSIKPASPQP
jgi:hypothetical protein